MQLKKLLKYLHKLAILKLYKRRKKNFKNTIQIILKCIVVISQNHILNNINCQIVIVISCYSCENLM